MHYLLSIFRVQFSVRLQFSQPRSAHRAERGALFRRLRWGCVALAALSVISSVYAEYPERAIKIIVPYPAGGTTDLLIRLVAPKLSERLQQPIIIENRAGAGGVLGSQIVAKSPADGYTLVFASIATHGIIPAIQKPPPYDPLRDFAPISLLATTPNVLIVNAGSPIKSVEDLIAQAKSKPGQLSFGSTSLGALLI